MNRDPDETLVYCIQCSGYLFSTYDEDGREAIGRRCPFKCRTEVVNTRDGRMTTVEVMDVPKGWGQRYGRS